MVLDDGTHMAKVKSKDNLRQLQFPTLRPKHLRDRYKLRSLRELEEQSKEDLD